MKKKTKIIIGTIVGLSTLAGIAFGVSKVASVINSNSNEPNTVQKLDTPKNVSYNENTYTLSWSEVKNADSYKVDINGTTYDVQDNEYTYVPRREVTQFSVQALDSTGTYQTSGWSTPISYTLSKTDGINQATLNSYVSEVIGDVEKIVSICLKNENTVNVSAVYNDGKLHNFDYKYDHNVESLASVVANNDYTRVRTGWTNTAKNYNTAEHYLKSSKYVGQLEEYRSNGYTISVVSSQAYEGNDRIGLVGVYKVTNGIETRYLSINHVFNLDPTAVESTRYTSKVENIDSSKVIEVSCVELQGDFVDALSCYDENTNYTTNMGSYYNDGGYSY